MVSHHTCPKSGLSIAHWVVGPCPGCAAEVRRQLAAQRVAKGDCPNCGHPEHGIQCGEDGCRCVDLRAAPAPRDAAGEDCEGWGDDVEATRLRRIVTARDLDTLRVYGGERRIRDNASATLRDAALDAAEAHREIAALRARCEALEDVLRTYGGHRHGCTANARLDCTCGYDAALAAARATPTASPSKGKE